MNKTSKPTLEHILQLVDGKKRYPTEHARDALKKRQIRPGSRLKREAASAISRITPSTSLRTGIDRLIINSPYEQPARHWFYERETHTFRGGRAVRVGSVKTNELKCYST